MVNLFRRNIHEAKKAYDHETEDVKKKTAFISSIFENCTLGMTDEDCAKSYVLNAYNAAANLSSDCLIFYGLSIDTDEANIDINEADRFIRALGKLNMNKEDETMDLNLKDNLVFGYEDAFNRIVEMVDDIMTWDKDELNIDYILRRCKKFDEWTKTLHYPNEIWYKDVTGRAVDCVRGYLVGFDMTHVFGNFMNTVTAHSCDNDIPEEARQPLRRLIHSLWVLTYGDKLDFNSIETRTVYYDSDLYQKEALRTENGMLPGGDPAKRLLNGLMGLNGESGECIDILKKHLFQGHELDREHLMEELGDVAWYLAVSANVIGYDLSDIFEMNIEKLRKRYPDGFETEGRMQNEYLHTAVQGLSEVAGS